MRARPVTLTLALSRKGVRKDARLSTGCGERRLPRRGALHDRLGVNAGQRAIIVSALRLDA
jgi:hypothetical protein